MRNNHGVFVLESNELVQKEFGGFQGIIIYSREEAGLFNIDEGSYIDGEYVTKNVDIFTIKSTDKGMDYIKNIVNVALKESYPNRFEIPEIAITEEVEKILE